MLFAFATEDADTTGYNKIRVPASTWAVFKSPEFTDREQTSTMVQALNKRVYQEWLPTAPFEQEEGFDMELYYGENGVYWNEIWIRVKPISQ